MTFKILNYNSNIKIDGPLLLKPIIFEDDRGHFFESWNNKEFIKLVDEEINFCQDNHSASKKGVLRGLHYQTHPQPQGKLVRCISGEIFDVAVDIRQTSATFGEWIGFYLNSENKKQLWIPKGFAHGFLTISSHAEVLYKASGYWSKSCERSIIWNDPTINIAWPLEKFNINAPHLAQKDSQAPTLIGAKQKNDLF